MSVIECAEEEEEEEEEDDEEEEEEGLRFSVSIEHQIHGFSCYNN